MSEASFTFVITSIEVALIGIGLIGNLLTIIIFSKKTFRSNSISTYCIALSVVELMTLTQFITDIYSLAYNIILSDQSDSFCKLFYSLPTFFSGIQPWVMVAFAVDKLICMRANSMSILKKKWFQWSVVAGIVIINTAIYIYMPILIKVREVYPGYFMCDLSTIGFFNIHMIINLLETSFIPFVVMIITSILTSRLLIKSRNAVMKTTGQVSKERKSRDTKYAISSVSFNILFITLKLPSMIFFTMSAFFSYYDLYFYKISVLTFYLNSSLSLFIHLVTNSLFRREFWVLFGLAKRNSASKLSHTISHTNHPIRLNQVSSMH